MQKDFSVKRGNTFNAQQFGITYNGTALDLTGSTISMQFRKSYKERLSHELTIGNGLSFVDAASGEFKIDEQIFLIPPYKYLYEIKIILLSGVTKSWIYGTFDILEDINRDE